jgi:pimeloyl-ACP methyl ester carboxylesterase
MRVTKAVTTKVDHVQVPGASLYYEVRGSGPALLMIPGGPTDANAFEPIAPRLADWYTVVTYDPRGLSRSSLDAQPDDRRMIEMMGNDASHLLAAIARDPAFVFGNSGGALIGLELAARHPEQVHTLVAHEPPLVSLFSDEERARAQAAMQEAYDTYQTSGVGPAMQKFLTAAGLNGEQRPAQSGSQGEPSPEMLEAVAHMQQNLELFFGHYLLAATAYEPDLSALKAGSPRIVAAVGETTQGQLARRGAVLLAKRLGIDVVIFPCDHGGFSTSPVEFAETLHKVIGGG